MEQAAFVQNISIIDNAFEIIHHMKCKLKGKKVEVAFKVEMSKAHDRIEWPYLRGLLLKMGFCQKWLS
uniref:Reverse transcriptase domain-containing protein n=1 Tax=Cajanus cajan TaxID=3821 RepID=A0A151RJS5_CAJCA|nr:hypothetical protein KK1_035788 [Cajanus cajan]